MITVSEQDRIKRDKFVETYRRTRPNHKNFKPKLESTSNDPATSSSTAASATATEDAGTFSGDEFDQEDDASLTKAMSPPSSASVIKQLHLNAF